MKYNVLSSDAKKVSVTITRRQLWDNYVDCWRDFAWDGEPMIDYLKKVHSVLCCEGELNGVELRKLFRNGDTVMLMGDAMQFLDNGSDILREIIVVDDSGKNVTISHADIIF